MLEPAPPREKAFNRQRLPGIQAPGKAGDRYRSRQRSQSADRCENVIPFIAPWLSADDALTNECRWRIAVAHVVQEDALTAHRIWRNTPLTGFPAPHQLLEGNTLTWILPRSADAYKRSCL